MTQPDPAQLRQMENEARLCEREDDFLAALDIYEEIERRGWATPEHYLAQGHCYRRNRQRQNAKIAWMKALDMAPDHAATREALDQYFPGWDHATPPGGLGTNHGAGTTGGGPASATGGSASTTGGRAASSTGGRAGSTTGGRTAPAPPGATGDAAPPPPPSFGSHAAPELVVETTVTNDTRRARQAPLTPTPGPAGRDFRVPMPTAEPTVETRSEQTIVRRIQQESVARVDRTERRVNWEYVLADAAEGMSTGKR